MHKSMTLAAALCTLGIWAQPGVAIAQEGPATTQPQPAKSAEAETPKAKVEPGALPTTATATASLVVRVHGFRNARGNGKLAVWRTKHGFPADETKAVERVLVPIVNGEGLVVIEGIEPGPCAVAVFHDENDDGKVDLGIFGIPREGLGISRDARGVFGPPTFEASKLVLAAGERRLASIRVVYY